MDCAMRWVIMRKSTLSNVMIAVGIDPGTIRMGWAVLRYEGSAVALLECGCFKESSKISLPQRLAGFHRNLCALMERYKPSVVCLEKAFVGTNAASALSLGCARGTIMVVAELYGARVQEHAPNAIKKNLTGRGRATKEDIVATVERFFGVKAGEDAADAVAIAFTATPPLLVG